MNQKCDFKFIYSIIDLLGFYMIPEGPSSQGGCAMPRTTWNDLSKLRGQFRAVKIS